MCRKEFLVKWFYCNFMMIDYFLLLMRSQKNINSHTVQIRKNYNSTHILHSFHLMYWLNSVSFCSKTNDLFVIFFKKIFINFFLCLLVDLQNKLRKPWFPKVYRKRQNVVVINWKELISTKMIKIWYLLKKINFPIKKSPRYVRNAELRLWRTRLSSN